MCVRKNDLLIDDIINNIINNFTSIKVKFDNIKSKTVVPSVVNKFFLELNLKIMSYNYSKQFNNFTIKINELEKNITTLDNERTQKKQQHKENKNNNNTPNIIKLDEEILTLTTQINNMKTTIKKYKQTQETIINFQLQTNKYCTLTELKEYIWMKINNTNNNYIYIYCDILNNSSK